MDDEVKNKLANVGRQKHLFFFHTLALNKRRKNKTSNIQKPDLSWISDPRDIELAFLTHLKNIYASGLTYQHDSETLSSTYFPSFITEFNLVLTRILDEQEIRKEVDSLHPFKSPREDRLDVVFYQKNWDIVKQKLLSEIQSIFLKKKPSILLGAQRFFA